MLSKSQIGLIKSLQDKRSRIENGLFIVEGEKMVIELIQSNFIIKAIYINTLQTSVNFKKKFEFREIMDWIEVSTNDLQKITFHSSAPSMIALVELPKNNDDKLGWPILVLEDIQDPGNLGTLIRIADWFNFKAIVTSPSSVSWHNPKVIQSSMGSFLRIPVLEKELVPFLQGTKKPLFTADLSGKSIFETNLTEMELVIFGNESRGISKSIYDLVTKSISIPGYGIAESLNIAVAAGIICAEKSRQGFQN